MKLRSRLEQQTFVIHTENQNEIGTSPEEIPVNDLLTLYESSNSEFSATERQLIQTLLMQATNLNKEMIINANIIRVGQDFP